MWRLGMITGLSWLALSCAEPFDAPSAYDGQQYVCDDAAALAPLVEACRADWTRDRSCAGVASFTGTLEGQRVTVTSTLSKATFGDVRLAGGELIRDNIDASGQSPYFIFVLSYKSMGGAAEMGAAARSLVFDVGAETKLDDLADDHVAGALRMTNGSDSADIAIVGGSVDLSMQTEDEQVGRFSADYARAGDHLDGCFHFFATKRTTQDE